MMNDPTNDEATTATTTQARIATLRAGYAAFNRRDIDGALAMLTADVAWPDMLEGRTLAGHGAVRAYWTRQFAILSSHVEPLEFVARDDRILIAIDQRVRRLDGEEVERREVGHLYTFRGGLASRMEVFADVADARRALHDASGDQRGRA